MIRGDHREEDVEDLKKRPIHIVKSSSSSLDVCRAHYLPAWRSIGIIRTGGLLINASGGATTIMTTTLLMSAEEAKFMELLTKRRENHTHTHRAVGDFTTHHNFVWLVKHAVSYTLVLHRENTFH